MYWFFGYAYPWHIWVSNSIASHYVMDDFGNSVEV
jgi:hypothetical protein